MKVIEFTTASKNREHFKLVWSPKKMIHFSVYLAIHGTGYVVKTPNQMSIFAAMRLWF